MICPKCGAQNSGDAWNCVSCRINLYWVTQHYRDLADLRERQGLPATASSPTFLVAAHKDAMDDRATRGGLADSKVRRAARKAMNRSAGSPDDSG